MVVRAVRVVCAMMIPLLAIPIGAVAHVDGARSRPPAPRAGHPGNVFLVGEPITVALPDAGSAWSLRDYADRELMAIPAGQIRADLGKLAVGWYRLRRVGSDEWVSLAVLEPLKAPIPTTSPIGVDVAMAWFYPEDRMADVASLAALAGMNRVRDRLAWGHVEPERGVFKPTTHYDTSARTWAESGLSALQVNHSTPSWAGSSGKRFPDDLRDAYTFYREMARRWRGQIAAFEPWNEADITAFGGHTGSEMAAMQKASYLGLKAGNPDVTVCLNVFAAHQRAQLDDLHANEAWPYFDTYNLHHYEAFEAYPHLYADHRSVSAGRPLWVTECSLPVRWSGDERLQEPSEADLHAQAERVAKIFAGSLHEGSRATFYFILGHYCEGQTQFGIVRRDLTPRPAYVALAAVGRLLADATPLGRCKASDGVYAYAFRARPERTYQTVIVAWARDGEATLTVPEQPGAVYDHLGRVQAPSGMDIRLTTAPVFIVLKSRDLRTLDLEAPPRAPAELTGLPSPVVLQPVFPEDTTLLWASAHRISGTEPTSAALAVYNFAETVQEGVITAEPPEGWKVDGLGPVRIKPMERLEIPIRIDPGSHVRRSVETLRFRGEFRGRPPAVASVRLAPDSSSLATRPGIAVPDAATPSAWDLLVSGGPAPRASVEADGVVFEAAPSGDPWFYPRLKLTGTPPIPDGTAGIALTITLLEGEDVVLRAILDETGGSSYVCDFVTRPMRGKAVETVALLEGAVYGAGWSAPDPNGKLDPSAVAALKIGCNSKAGPVRFKISNLRWVTW